MKPLFYPTFLFTIIALAKASSSLNVSELLYDIDSHIQRSSQSISHRFETRHVQRKVAIDFVSNAWQDILGKGTKVLGFHDIFPDYFLIRRLERVFELGKVYQLFRQKNRNEHIFFCYPASLNLQTRKHYMITIPFGQITSLLSMWWCERSFWKYSQTCTQNSKPPYVQVIRVMLHRSRKAAIQYMERAKYNDINALIAVLSGKLKAR